MTSDRQPLVERAASANALTQSQRTALSDQRMLDAAVDLICRHGTRRTTLQAIGDASGYSRGLATYRFGSKAGLFETLVHSISQTWRDSLEKAIGDLRGLAAVVAASNAYYQFVLDAPKPIRAMNILFMEAAAPDSPLAQTVEKINTKRLADVENWLRQGQQDGSVRNDIDPNVEATRFIAYCAGILTLWMVSPKGLPFAAAHEQQHRYLTDYLAPSAQR